MYTETQIMIKNGSKTPHSITGRQGNAIQSKHLVSFHITRIFKAEYNNLSFIRI